MSELGRLPDQTLRSTQMVQPTREQGQQTNGNGHVAPSADLVSIRDYGDVACQETVELVIFRFPSFGRLAHLRHWLLSLPGVTSARIAGYAQQTALFSLALVPGVTSGGLVPPGTKLISSDGRRLELCVDNG